MRNQSLSWIMCVGMVVAGCVHHPTNRYKDSLETATDVSNIIPAAALAKVDSYSDQCLLKLSDARAMDLAFQDKKWRVSAVGGTVALVTGFAASSSGGTGAVADISELGYVSLGSGVITLAGGIYAIWGVNSSRAEIATTQAIDLSNYYVKLKDQLRGFYVSGVQAAQFDKTKAEEKAKAVKLMGESYTALIQAAGDCGGYVMQIVPQVRKMQRNELNSVSAAKPPQSSETSRGLFKVVGVPAKKAPDAYPELEPLPDFAKLQSESPQ